MVRELRRLTRSRKRQPARAGKAGRRRIAALRPLAGLGEDGRAAAICGLTRPSQHLRLDEDEEDGEAQLVVSFDSPGKHRSSRATRRRRRAVRRAQGGRKGKEK